MWRRPSLAAPSYKHIMGMKQPRRTRGLVILVARITRQRTKNNFLALPLLCMVTNQDPVAEGFVDSLARPGSSCGACVKEPVTVGVTPEEIL